MPKEIFLMPVKILTRKYARELVDILNCDIKLIQQLGGNQRKISYAEFVGYNKKWAKENKALMFAIIKEDKAIGMISLSHINVKKQSAKIGYWIASEYWNRGYASTAFEKILDLAVENNIRFVSCSIPKENKASKAIWKKFGAKFEEKENFIIPSLCIKSEQGELVADK